MAQYRKIPGLAIEDLKNASYLELMQDVAETGRASQGIVSYAPAILAKIEAQATALAAEMGEMQKSPLTAQITETDQKRDKALIATKDALRAACENPDPDVKSAAQWLAENTRLLRIKATPQYDQQTGEITVALGELLDRQPERTEQATIKPYVMQLKRLNDQMCQLLIQRDTEKGAQGKSKVSDMRREMDKTYRELVDQVNALDIAFQLGALRDQPEQNPFQTFIDHLVGQIDRFKREILNRKPKKEEEATEEVTEEVTQTPDGEQETTTETDTETTLTPDDARRGRKK